MNTSLSERKIMSLKENISERMAEQITRDYGTRLQNRTQVTAGILISLLSRLTQP